MIFLLVLFYTLGAWQFCIPAPEENTMQSEIKLIDEQIKNEKKEYAESKEKIKIKKGLQLSRLDRNDPTYKNNVKEIKKQTTQKIKALKQDWQKKYKDLQRKRKETIKRYKNIKKSLDIQEKELKKRRNK